MLTVPAAVMPMRSPGLMVRPVLDHWVAAEMVMPGVWVQP
jgi:hypothetical protein